MDLELYKSGFQQFNNEIMNCKELTKKRKKLLVALSMTKGNILKACQMTGLSREVHYLGMEEKNYKNFYEQINEQLIDWVEDKFFSLIDKEDFRAISLFLTTKGKKRGYQLDNQININNQPNIIEIIYNEPKNIKEIIELKEIENGTTEEVNNLDAEIIFAD